MVARFFSCPPADAARSYGHGRGTWHRGSYRWAEGRQERYAGLAQDFVRSKVDVIVTSGTAPTMAAKKATSAIPIVFAAAGDPVRTKLVANLARPGRNVTGMSNGQTDL